MHTFLSLDMNLIPQVIKDSVPTFWQGRFNKDKSRMLMDGYNEQRELVHPPFALDIWLSGVENKEEVLAALLEQATEYTAEEMIAETNDPTSMWYVEIVED